MLTCLKNISTCSNGTKMETPHNTAAHPLARPRLPAHPPTGPKVKTNERTHQAPLGCLTAILNKLTPEGYTIKNSNHPHKRGGGVACIYKISYPTKATATPTYQSFEHIALKGYVDSRSSCLLIILYQDFLTKLLTLSKRLVIIGDLNLHLTPTQCLMWPPSSHCSQTSLSHTGCHGTHSLRRPQTQPCYHCGAHCQPYSHPPLGMD